jgi:hypothetical protein
MRRAFKVATVFTGVAACGTFLTAGVQAATATTAKAEPATGHGDCAIGPRTTSMVFHWFSTSNHGPTCAGSGGVPGSTKLDHSFASICTGNNKGWMSTGNGVHYKFLPYRVGPTLAFLPTHRVETVYISGHSGDSPFCST